MANFIKIKLTTKDDITDGSVTVTKTIPTEGEESIDLDDVIKTFLLGRAFLTTESRSALMNIKGMNKVSMGLQTP